MVTRASDIEHIGNNDNRVKAIIRKCELLNSDYIVNVIKRYKRFVPQSKNK